MPLVRLSSLLACLSVGAVALAESVHVSGARTVAHEGGKSLHGYSVSAGHPLTVKASGPGYLVIRARGLGAGSSLELTAVRDGAAQSITQRSLPASAGGKLGGTALSGPASIELTVPAGDHKYELSVSANAFLQIGPAAQPNAAWAAAAEQPMAVALVAEPAPAPPPIALAPATRSLEAQTDAAVAPAEGNAVAATAPASADKKDDGRSPFGLALELALVLPNGQPAGVVQSGDGSPTGKLSPSYAGSVEISYVPDFGGWHDLSIALSAGYYPLSGNGSRSLPADPDFGNYSWNWNATSIPLTLGLAYRLPLGIPVHLSPVAGFVAAHTSISSSYSQSGGGGVTDAAQTAWAYGFYAGAEGSLSAGPGEILLVARYMNARTDLGFQKTYPGQPWNAAPGDIEGTNVQLGYRFNL
ncbi:MAG: hypothetical protein ACYCWW_06730 [Deltaproteobacteria bacterium]